MHQSHNSHYIMVFTCIIFLILFWYNGTKMIIVRACTQFYHLFLSGPDFIIYNTQHNHSVIIYPPHSLNILRLKWIVDYFLLSLLLLLYSRSSLQSSARECEIIFYLHNWIELFNNSTGTSARYSESDRRHLRRKRIFIENYILMFLLSFLYCCSRMKLEIHSNTW